MYFAKNNLTTAGFNAHQDELRVRSRVHEIRLMRSKAWLARARPYKQHKHINIQRQAFELMLREIDHCSEGRGRALFSGATSPSTEEECDYVQMHAGVTGLDEPKSGGLSRRASTGVIHWGWDTCGSTGSCRFSLTDFS